MNTTPPNPLAADAAEIHRHAAIHSIQPDEAERRLAADNERAARKLSAVSTAAWNRAASDVAEAEQTLARAKREAEELETVVLGLQQGLVAIARLRRNVAALAELVANAEQPERTAAAALNAFLLNVESPQPAAWSQFCVSLENLARNAAILPTAKARLAELQTKANAKIGELITAAQRAEISLPKLVELTKSEAAPVNGQHQNETLYLLLLHHLSLERYAMKP